MLTFWTFYSTNNPEQNVSQFPQKYLLDDCFKISSQKYFLSINQKDFWRIMWYWRFDPSFFFLSSFFLSFFLSFFFLSFFCSFFLKRASCNLCRFKLNIWWYSLIITLLARYMYVSIIVCSACIEWSVIFSLGKNGGKCSKGFFLVYWNWFSLRRIHWLKLWQLAPVSTTTALPHNSTTIAILFFMNASRLDICD